MRRSQQREPHPASIIVRGLEEVARRKRELVHARLPIPHEFTLACLGHVNRFATEVTWTRLANKVTCADCKSVLRRYPTMVERMREEEQSEGFADQLEKEEAERLDREARDLADWNHDHADRFPISLTEADDGF